MLDPLIRSPPGQNVDAALAASLARAAGARLDQVVGTHPLRPAFLHRVRLEKVRHQAAVDGRGIDPWHLAAVLEGFRLRTDGALRIIDRGTVLDAARHALGLHQWRLVAPDFDQEGVIQRAEKCLAAQARATPLLAAAQGIRTWIENGAARPPIRAALIRFWTREKSSARPCR